jgi:hypothetical protein
MKKHLFYLLSAACVLSISDLKSQTEFGETFKSRLYVGSNFALNLGSFTSLDISPMVGYNFNRYVSAGIGTSYIFYSIRYPNFSQRASFYGGRVFGRLLPFPDALPGLFVHAEAETINNEQYTQDPSSNAVVLRRVWTPAYFLGGGFRQKVGNNSYFTISLLFNLADDGLKPTIYPNIIVYRVGFIVGLF